MSGFHPFIIPGFSPGFYHFTRIMKLMKACPPLELSAAMLYPRASWPKGVEK
jgi:hypothetical protein